LTDKYEDYGSSYDTLYIDYLSKEALFDSVILVRDSDVVKKLIVHAENLNELWNDFCKHYKFVEAAGGIVLHDNKVLMIKKNGHWDLPKGKIDGSESTEDAAKREVSEECGLKDLSITSPLDTTYYMFQENSHTVLKKTSWFNMTSKSEGPLKGDEKEGITEVKWVDATEWEQKKSQSYPSVNKLLASIF
jgi:8-oxo-dGTP pyrophosphatase MutT (NUDIX family)